MPIYIIRTTRVGALALALATVFFLSGCLPSTMNQNRYRSDADIIKEAHSVADALVKHLNAPIDRKKPILTASFVNIDQLDQSSSLGRMLAEQVASRFAQLGLHVVELKLRDTLFIQREAGEFILSRELRQISQSHEAQAVLAGTYAVGTDNVYVTVRLVRTTDSKILAAEDFFLPMGRDTRSLVRDSENRR